MSRRFQAGGALRKGTFYVRRSADVELPEALCRGELCHVLAPRQMGKSSLRLRVDTVLRRRGVRSCCVDLSSLGSTDVTPEQWYYGLVDAVSRSLGLADPEGFWGLLDAVFDWTQGHPYMTHKVCDVLSDESMADVLPAGVRVARLIGDLFMRRGRVEDLSLSAVERLFTRGRSGPRMTEMLTLYQRLLKDEHVLAVSDDPVQTALRLAGLAAESDDGATVWMRVRNPIVERVFDNSWVQERLAAR